ncbi:DEAD-domain-containing protein [Laetiporus sulphureus 93-53]|uniref:RNA helicase n=1 Tax=Laetiporus sulphureus 93-53 TaxID=1314785 RepID=A0A165GYZ1_9APHY|nr:DEAD-domain-containing protein [Laetiporus sulphureus 93-53]KZT11018.1 DEAD-domain-containing protein [Laetiporus sulphureus 93-53]
MSHSKRKRSQLSDTDESLDGFASDDQQSENEIDISAALAGRAAPKVQADADHDDDEQLQKFINEATTKRDVKWGTDLLKKTKGKAKMTKGEVGGGSFQSMGLYPWLLRSLTLQGFRIPTPIQRLSVPALIANPPRDLVGMARTGSGKSLAYMVPLIQRLSGRHSPTFGARALILLPSRELALQVLKVGKELARGWHAGEGDHAGDGMDADDGKKGQGLRWSLIVGGEGLDEQFEMITQNPDVIIATPGRLLHLIVEMNMDLKSIQYVVFDEADRLFEMGFETALTEILHRLPATRQTLLFSATLPKSLVEFAKAGLQNPKLVRLDAESKISPDLKMAFFSVKQAEKDACLLVLLRDVIGVPLGASKASDEDHDEALDKKGKGKAKARHREHVTAPHQTLVFAATKHHVEYLTNMLISAGYAVSHIYGSLDQAARTQHMERFRRGHTSILVVTDVAARGIDIPVLENVVNYDFPQGARVFIHRVGRTARAGRPGWAWSFVTNPELPYLLDLQLFLGRPIKGDVSEGSDRVYTESLVLGQFDRDNVDDEVEYIKKLDEENHNLSAMRDVMRKGHGMYERSKGKASQASYKRAKEMMKEGKWGLVGSDSGVHPVFFRNQDGSNAAGKLAEETKRKALLKAVSSFRPAETVLEIGARGNTETATLMKQRRKALNKAAQRASLASTSTAAVASENHAEDDADSDVDAEGIEMADEEEIAAVFDSYHGDKRDSNDSRKSYRDSEFYMSHYQKDANTEKGYSLRDGATFAEQAQNLAFDLAGDEGVRERKRRELNWDKKKKKFVKGTGEGADNVKLVRTESGVKLPATYRSGRFDEWKAKTRTSLPKVGEAEAEGSFRRGASTIGGRKFKHNQVATPKPLDKLSKDYERKTRQKKKRLEHEGGEDVSSPSSKPSSGKKGRAVGRRPGGKSVRTVRNELKTVDQIRKDRKLMEKRRTKNARPNHKKGRR